jgi:hypothetical protein
LDPTSSTDGERVAVESVVHHPQHVNSHVLTYEYNIAELASPLRFRQSETFAGQLATVLGWGATSEGGDN